MSIFQEKMSFKRGPKPARPPPPRGTLSLGELRFKKLEQEEEEDLTIFTDKYASVLQQSRNSSSPAGLSSVSKVASESSTVKPADLSSALGSDVVPLEVDHSSPSKKVTGKSVFEYKELLSGAIKNYKDRITEKISKKIEDLSGESSASTSPDKEQPVAGPLDILQDRSLESLQQTQIVKKSSPVQTWECEQAVVFKLGSAQKLPDMEEKMQGSPEKKTAGSTTVKVNKLPLEGEDEEEGEEEEENVIKVHEEYYSELPEDFAGHPGITASTALRPRSKLQGLKKKNAKMSAATMSMSKLMRTPEMAGAAKGKETTSDQSDSANIKSDDKDNVTPVDELKQQKSAANYPTHDQNSVPWQKLLTFMAGVFAYFIIPLPSFLSGMLTGCLLTSMVWVIYGWLIQKPKPRESVQLVPIKDLPPIDIPEMKEPLQEDGIFKVRAFIRLFIYYIMGLMSDHFIFL